MKVGKLLAGVLVLGGLALSATGASAQVSMKPKILLHVKAVTSKNQCTPTGVTTCSQAVITGALNQFYHVQVLVAESDSINNADSGIAGVQFGLDYMGGFDPSGNAALALDIFGWSLCATLEFQTPSPAPIWPGPGSGNLITWDAVTICQRGAVATAGYFYLTAYSASTLKIIPRPVDGAAKVADCGSLEIPLNPGDLGFAAFSAGQSVAGCNPCVQRCDMVAVQGSTWSKIKTLNH